MARQIAASLDAKPERLTDQRMSTTLRIEPALLRELKYAAVEDDKKVNDLILEGVHHVLACGVADEVPSNPSKIVARGVSPDGVDTTLPKFTGPPAAV